jgi:hypothetical protein
MRCQALEAGSSSSVPPPAPDHLQWPSLLEDHWMLGGSGGILLTQTCGLPLVTSMAASLKAVAMPCYRCDRVFIRGLLYPFKHIPTPSPLFPCSAPGCHGWSYSSVIIAPSSSAIHSIDHILRRHHDLVVAVNSLTSLSGCLALQATIAHPLCLAAFELPPPPSAPPPSSFFKRIDITGSHSASLERVAASSADVACIDCVTYALLLQQQPSISRQIRVIARTPSAPCLPYCTSITSSQATCDLLLQALQAAAADPCLQSVREALKITGFQPYSCVLTEDPRSGVRPLASASASGSLRCAPVHGVSAAKSPLPQTFPSPHLLLCPYQLAVSRLYLRARGSSSVRTLIQSTLQTPLDDAQVNGSELLAAPGGISPATAACADLAMAGAARGGGLLRCCGIVAGCFLSQNCVSLCVNCRKFHLGHFLHLIGHSLHQSTL